MARPQPAGPAPAVVAQHLVIRYAKRGRMRFASHRDVARAVERGVRKAGLPIAHSAGFSPHPKISYAGGAPTGVASEAEYLEISLTRPCPPAVVRDGLDAALPDGIDVMEVCELAAVPGSTAGGVPPGASSGTGGIGGLRLEVSDWRLVLPGVTPEEAARAADAFLGEGSVEVERLTSKGMRRLDARAAVVSLQADRRAAEGSSAGCAILRMVVRHLTPAVRPDDILTALRKVAGLQPSSPPLVTRLAQGPLDPAAEAPGLAGLMHRPELDAVQGQEKATRLEATDAATAAVIAPASAYEQLPRGAGGPETDPRARECDGRLPACSTASDKTNKTPKTGRPPLVRPTV